MSYRDTEAFADYADAPPVGGPNDHPERDFDDWMEGEPRTFHPISEERKEEMRQDSTARTAFLESIGVSTCAKCVPGQIVCPGHLELLKEFNREERQKKLDAALAKRVMEMKREAVCIGG